MTQQDAEAMRCGAKVSVLKDTTDLGVGSTNNPLYVKIPQYCIQFIIESNLKVSAIISYLVIP